MPWHKIRVNQCGVEQGSNCREAVGPMRHQYNMSTEPKIGFEMFAQRIVILP